MLIEVMVSALLVALIVVATLTGFDNADRASAEERRHAQAAVLAAQSQEQLRSDSGATLSELYGSPHKYERTAGGTTYTVTQEAKAVNSGGTGTGCSATETSSQAGADVQIVSTVTWATQLASKRTATVLSSIVSPPSGSTLEVDVQNGASPAAGVSGVTVQATYTPTGSQATNTVTATTGAAGCVLFTALPTTKAIVAINEKLAYVTTSGLVKYPSKEVTLAPNVTTHYVATYNEGGRIAGEFSYEGKTGQITHEGRKETVTGDTFVAYNSSLPPSPYFQVGSTSFEYEAGGEERYKAVTGTYAATAYTAKEALYPAGDLFPFPGAWQVYGGDCRKDNIETASSEKLKPESAHVEAGKTSIVKVPLSYVLVKAKKGTAYNEGAADGSGYEVKIKNRECETEGTPDNATAANLVHIQHTNSEGHLEHPFQPYGKYELCLYNSTLNNRYTWTFDNTTVAGSSLTVFPSELSKSAWEAEEAKNVKQWEKEGRSYSERKEKAEKQKKERTESEEKRKTDGYTIESGTC